MEVFSCIATFACSDLIGQDVVGGCAGFKLLARRVRHSRQLWCGKYTKSYLPHFTGGYRYVIIVLGNIYVILCLHMW